MTTSLPANIADFTSVLDDVVATANSSDDKDEDGGGGDNSDGKGVLGKEIGGGGGLGGFNQSMPKFHHSHPLDSLLTPAASPEEDSLEPWIQTV